MLQNRQPITITRDETHLPELPCPEGAIANGYNELFRLWYRAPQADAENERGTMDVQMRKTFEHPFEWAEPIAMMAHTVAELYGRQAELTNEQKRTLATTLLIKAAEILGLSDLVEQFAAEMVKQQQAPMQPGEEHPGSVPVPPEVLGDEGSKQLLNVWLLPTVDECDHCGGTHEGQTYIGGQTDVLTARELGSLLGGIAKIHSSELHQKDKTERLKTLAAVQQSFHETVDEGIAHA